MGLLDWHTHYLLYRPFYDVALLLGFYFLVWIKAVGEYEFLIDDDFGIQPYSERWVQDKDRSGKVVREYKLDGYDVETGSRDEKGKPVLVRRNFFKIIPELGFPGMILRFLRVNIGKKWKVIGKNVKDHEIYGYVQSSFRHHLFSFIVHAVNLILAYTFLSSVFGNRTALLATLLFSATPVACQTVAWISGINYLFSLFGILATLNVAVYVPSYYLSVPLVVLTTAIAGFTLIPGVFVSIILLTLGYNWCALASGIIGLIIILREGRSVTSYRTQKFVEQNMGASTKISPLKIILFFKTLWYYLCMTPMPMKLGLYHEWGYSFDDPIKKADMMFLKGFIAFLALVGTAVYFDGLVRFGIIWYLVFYLIFSNIITAQQFVAERYIFISHLGFCMVSSLLPFPIWCVLLGMYAMRVWTHLWTFRTQEDFYLSNWLNFRGSEAALGNLGVIQRNKGWHGASIDTWARGTQTNPLYDVNWYNLYSAFKSAGDLDRAHHFLTKCLNAKTVHFHNKWKEEMEQLESLIKYRKGLNIQQMNKEIGANS